MIDDVDRSLRAFLDSALAGEDVLVSFDRPTTDLDGDEKQSGTPVIDLFLHDVREDLDARVAFWNDVRDDGGRVVGRQPPPRHYQLSYLVSVWGVDTEREHRLLGSVLGSVLEREQIPAEFLQGQLAAGERPVVVQAAVPAAAGTARTDELWSALGLPLRASVTLLVVAPLVPALSTELAPPAERIDLGMKQQQADLRPGGARAAAAARDAEAGDVAAPEIPGRIVRRWTGVKIREHSDTETPEPAP